MRPSAQKRFLAAVIERGWCFGSAWETPGSGKPLILTEGFWVLWLAGHGGSARAKAGSAGMQADGGSGGDVERFLPTGLANTHLQGGAR